MRNIRKPKSNTTGFKGVHWNAKTASTKPASAQTTSVCTSGNSTARKKLSRRYSAAAERLHGEFRPD